jgi:hypothetical protein
MSTDNITPISAARKPNAELARLLNEQINQVYRAKNLVGTTAKSLDENDNDRRGTLEAACEVLQDIVDELDRLAHLGLNPPPEQPE